MKKRDFLRAKLFMFSDVEREIQLAKTKKAELLGLGINPGGGNFLAALGLLCYTEFGGKLSSKTDKARQNFDLFFDRLGPSYVSFRGKHPKVYDTFRCGLAHEFYVKKNCTIYMLAKRGRPGIWQTRGGHFRFSVEKYYQDLKAAFEGLQVQLYGP
jgi:hypothetical protein